MNGVATSSLSRDPACTFIHHGTLTLYQDRASIHLRGFNHVSNTASLLASTDALLILAFGGRSSSCSP